MSTGAGVVHCGEAAALKLMVQDGAAFSELCAALFEEFGEQAPMLAATWLKQRVGEGLLIRVT